MRDLTPLFVIIAVSFIAVSGIRFLHDSYKANEKLYQSYKANCDSLGGITATSFDGRVICVKELK